MRVTAALEIVRKRLMCNETPGYNCLNCEDCDWYVTDDDYDIALIILKRFINMENKEDQ